MDINYPEISDQDMQSIIDQIEDIKHRQNISNETHKLSDAPAEIVFNITANVVEQNEQEENIRSKQICTKYYHIPIPSGADHNIFMNTFFNFLENNLASAATQAYNETSVNNNTEVPNHE